MGHLSMNIARLSGLGFYIMIRDQHGKPEVVWQQDQAQIHTPQQVSTQVSLFFWHWNKIFFKKTENPC